MNENIIEVVEHFGPEGRSFEIRLQLASSKLSRMFSKCHSHTYFITNYLITWPCNIMFLDVLDTWKNALEAIITAFWKGFLGNTIKFSSSNSCNFSYAHKYCLLLLICCAVARCQHSTLSQQLLIYKCLQLWYRVHKLRPKFLICDGCNKIQDYNSYAKYYLVAKYNFYFYKNSLVDCLKS